MPHQRVFWKREQSGELLILGFRSEEQAVLQKSGDDLRIDWGTALLAAPRDAEAIVGDIDYCRDAFIQRGELSAEHLLRMPRKSTYWGEPVLAVKLELACDRARDGAGLALIGHDDEYAVEYFGKPLRAWWRRDADASPQRMLTDAYAEFAAVRSLHGVRRAPRCGSGTRRRC